MRNFIDLIGAPETEEEFDGGCSCCFKDMDSELGEAHDATMNYDLQKKYNDFNQKFFAGELPDIPITWSNRKGVGGLVSYRFKAKPGTPVRQKHARRNYGDYELIPGTMKMTISRNFLRDEGSLDGIMLHEMIHVYMASIAGLIGEQHGPNFMKMLRELSTRSGIDIPLTDDTSDYVINPENKIKEFVVMLVRKSNGDVSYGIINKNTIMKEEALVALSLDWARRAKHFGFVVELYLVKDAAWSGLVMGSNLKEQRGKVTTLYKMRPELKDSLLSALEKSDLIITLPPKT